MNRAEAILAEAGMPPDPELRAALPDFDLGELASAGVQPPQMLCDGMLYAGGVHCLAGQPGGGKTTVMAWWMLCHIRSGGRVMLLDEESGPELMAEKFLDLGASPAELRPPGFSYVPFAGRGWNLGDLGQLHERVAEREPGIIAWDSAAAFLSIAGRDENSAGDVTGFWQRVLMPCARQFGAAVIAVDHTGRNIEHGGYGRGSGAKKAASDVLFIVETVRPFNRSQDGLLKLTTSPGKDRRGHLPVACEVLVRKGPPLTLEVSEVSGDTPAAAREVPPAKAKLLEALAAAADGPPVTSSELVDRIAGKHGHGLKRQTVSTFLNELAREGLADSLDQGHGKPKLWSAVPQAADGSRYLARRDPAAPEVRPPCRHEACFDALVGRCLQEDAWPAGSFGEEPGR